MAYNNNYKFTRSFTKDGKETKWHQVVEFIKANGPVSKREIVKAIWRYDGLDENIRGYQSSMFAQLNEIQPEGVHYDKDLKKWTTYGNNGNNGNNDKNDNKKKSRRVSLPVIVDMPVTLHLSNKNYIKDIEDTIEMLEKSTTNLKNILKFIKSNIN